LPAAVGVNGEMKSYVGHSAVAASLLGLQDRGMAYQEAWHIKRRGISRGMAYQEAWHIRAMLSGCVLHVLHVQCEYKSLCSHGYISNEGSGLCGGSNNASYSCSKQAIVCKALKTDWPYHF